MMELFQWVIVVLLILVVAFLAWTRE